MNSTDPVGVPPPEAGATVAVSVAVWPSTAAVEVKKVEVGVADIVPCSARVFAPELPTAQQSELLTQATPERTLDVDRFGLGVGTIDHVAPFHCSARVGPIPVVWLEATPTAQQSEVLTQATPERKLTDEVVLGVGTMDQALPFHCSANVCPGAPLMGKVCPTAQQSEVLTQATPERRENVEGFGLGVGTMDQMLPFHCSIKVWPVPPLWLKLSLKPTVQQSAALRQATPERLLVCEVVLGVGTMDQALPFQCSIKVCCREVFPLGTVAVPTAQQSEASTQATPERLLACGLLLGVGTTDQALPFQCSATLPLPVRAEPTAQQSELVTQVTPERMLCCDALGLGVVMMDQESPLAPAVGLELSAPTTTPLARSAPAIPNRMNRRMPSMASSFPSA
jgi:hypothetical protein